MSDGARASKDDRKPPTPHDFALLKGIRYEDAADGLPPVPVKPVNLLPRPSTAAHPHEPNSPAKRPRTSPNPRAAALSEQDEVKRDSAIAPSLSTATRDSYAESHQSLVVASASREPTLPTILVHDEEFLDPNGRSKSPFGSFGRKSRDKARSTKLQAQPPLPSGIQRIRSFKGIQADIPTGNLGDIDLEDLASDKVGFSQRGSLLFGGRKMNELLAAQGDSTANNDGTIQPMGATRDDLRRAPEPDAKAGDEVEPESPMKGLVTGRRKPSVHMLQAALLGGRVLSAEEIGFSMKVRSMYEHGDERAAEWALPMKNGSQGSHTPESMGRDSSTPDLSINGIVVDKTRQAPNGHAGLRPPSAQDVPTSYSREAHEYAGGIEDWEDVEGRDVDRYGFINTGRSASRNSNGSQRHGEGVHRVATALRLEAEQPRRERKLRRGLSTARSSRSMPPRPSGDGIPRKAPGSMHSFRSGESRQSSANPFQSRDRRTLAEAADMLSLPPGLSDIAEQNDGGKTPSLLKRREWSREDKWQKMARPVRDGADNKGGGMHFEFDTSDPKLVNRTWKGIPDRWRATAWHCFLSTSAKRRGSYVSDEVLAAEYHKLQKENAADDVQIDVDVPRTINLHIMFRRRYRGGQRLLFRVLHAISLYCPEPGYVQGMASLAATLLCYYDEERAFVMMVRLWQLRGLDQLFQSEFAGLLAALNEFEREWLRGGDVAQTLEELCVPSTSYGTRWYLTLFNLSIPFPAQLRVWDVFMLLGDAAAGQGQAFGGADLDVLHATSAALIDATRDIIVDADFEVAMKVLTSFIPIKDEDLLMRVARTEWKMRKKRAGVKV
ncbi:hypothetical protein LTR36_008668 [Oleoguttula mirabilis]|uniref:Rab-GAP TBC domain-containing protein n=1 Tax=Oleoguttula mirabilis TaxID=1507867 RepID=A0AAV9JUE3_9PEZI|nr:hypothetical protein LTR36_008668 [Oleoguttula mirabilis]